MSASVSRWRFFRAGGVDQVRLASGADLLALDALDPKLWVALACPTTGVEFDRRALQLFDMDGDGRIRVGDLVALVRFLRPLLRDPEDLVGGKQALPLSGIDTRTDEGRAMQAAAQAALESLGKAGEAAVGTTEAGAALASFQQRPFNGDGVIPPDAAGEDAALRADLQSMVDALGGEKDFSGKMGVGRATLDAFFAEAEAFLAWQRAGDEGDIQVLGDGTAAAWSLVTAVEEKIEDFFARCRVSAFDARATALLNRDEKDYLPVALGRLSADARELADFPLAQVSPSADATLPLSGSVNPAWADKLSALSIQVVRPLLGEPACNALTHAQWTQVRAALAPYAQWLAAKKGARVEGLGRARVEALLAGDSRAKAAALIEQDLGYAPQAKALESLERLIVSVRYLQHFCNNFVNFRDFYRQERKAIFQIGTLYLDRRSCDLCLQVENVATHVSTAGLARAYLAYCDCTRKATGQKMTIVAAITNGDSDNLLVGRNGLFRDRQGTEWDATVVRIVDNPISVRQAFWSPYKKLVRFIEEQVARRAAEKESASQKQLTTAANETFTAAETAPPPPGSAVATSTSAASPSGPAGQRRPFDIGVVAALGVAVGGLTAAFGALLHSFFGLGLWMPLGLLALLLVISGPSMLIAWLKLRQRNLGPLLDANGWAVNAMARVNVPLGRSLTEMARLPEGAARDLRDPFAEPRRPWLPWAVALLVATLLGLWAYGRLDPWLPERIQATRTFGWDPAVPAPPLPDPAAPIAPVP